MIKLFLTDVDGCLTDGGYYSMPQKNDKSLVAKKFNTRDFHGLFLLHKAGVEIGFVTTCSDFATKDRLSSAAPYGTRLMGVSDKAKTVEECFINTGKFQWSEIAYIGDDELDLGLLSKVGMPSCPSDAEEEVIEFVLRHPDGLVTTRVGGNACVREFSNVVRKIVEYNGSE